jgi:hypothetical protein
MIRQQQLANNNNSRDLTYKNMYDQLNVTNQTTLDQSSLLANNNMQVARAKCCCCYL